MNKQKLESLAKCLENLPPENFHMNWWHAIKHEDNEDMDVTTEVSRENATQCGTSCCIAGWHCLKMGMTMQRSHAYLKGADYGRAEDVAQRDLGLTEDEREVLFYDYKWPYNPETGERFPSTPEGAAARIRYMIETGK